MIVTGDCNTETMYDLGEIPADRSNMVEVADIFTFGQDNSRTRKCSRND